MTAQQVAVGAAKRPGAREVFTLVDDVPGQSHNILRLPARFRQYGNDVGQRLARLPDEIVRFEFAVRVPAQLSGKEYDPACRRDPVRVSARLPPRRWLQN